MTAEQVNDPVLTVIVIFFAVIMLVALWAMGSLIRQWWSHHWAARAAEADAAANHSEDCPRCAPARARLQQLDPLHGLTEREFLDLVQSRPRADVGDDGAWQVMHRG